MASERSPGDGPSALDSQDDCSGCGEFFELGELECGLCSCCVERPADLVAASNVND